MKVENVKALKTVYYPALRHQEQDKEINELFRSGWRILTINENPNGSSYMYFVHDELNPMNLKIKRLTDTAKLPERAFPAEGGF